MLTPPTPTEKDELAAKPDNTAIKGLYEIRLGEQVSDDTKLYMIGSKYNGMGAYNYQTEINTAPFDQIVFFANPDTNDVVLIELTGMIDSSCKQFNNFIINDYASSLIDLRVDLKRYKESGYGIQFYDDINNNLLLFKCTNGRSRTSGESNFIEMIMFNRELAIGIVIADLFDTIEDKIVSGFGVLPYFEEDKQLYVGTLAFLGMDEDLLLNYSYKHEKLAKFGDFSVLYAYNEERLAGVKFSAQVENDCKQLIAEYEKLFDKKLGPKKSRLTDLLLNEFDVGYEDDDMMGNSLGLRCVSLKEDEYLEL